jgi:hypothetical protein
MKSTTLAFMLLGCSDAPAPAPTLLELMPPAVFSAIATGVVTEQHSAIVVAEYAQAAATERAAVTAPTATPESVRSIDSADRDARVAVHALLANPAPVRLARAHEAIRYLAAVVDRCVHP